MTQPALESAVSRLKNGDASAFDYIFDHTYKVVYFVAHQILQNKQDAEDITHDTYVSAIKHINDYSTCNFLAWLTTIAKRKALNQKQRLQRDVLVDFTADNALNIKKENSTCDTETYGLLALAEKILSQEDFLIVISIVVAGYKRRELSIMFGLPISTVSYRYSQALKTLKTKWSEVTK